MKRSQQSQPPKPGTESGRPSFWQHLVSTGWTSPQGVAAASTAVAVAVAGVPTAIGYIFMTVHVATDKGSAPSTWAFIPGVPTPLPIGIAATLWMVLIALTFCYPGYMASFAPIREESGSKERRPDWPRILLFGTAAIAVVIWGTVAFTSFRMLHLTIPGWTILAPAILGWGAGMWAAWVQHGGATAIKSFAFRFALSAVYWLSAAYTISQLMNAVARQQNWNWNTNFLPWEYLIVFIIGMTTAALFASLRNPKAALAMAVIMMALLAGFDAKDFFAAPFRGLHLL